MKHIIAWGVGRGWGLVSDYTLCGLFKPGNENKELRGTRKTKHVCRKCKSIDKKPTKAE